MLSRKTGGQQTKEQRGAHIALTVSMILMGTAYVGAKFALRVTGPFTTAFFRFLIASLIMWPLLFTFRLFQPVRRQHVGLLIRHALFQTTLYFSLQYAGLQYTTASNTALITNTRPIILALIAVIFLKEHFSRVQWAALLLSFLGVFVILQDPQANVMPNHLRGDFLILLNALSGALGIVFLKQLLKDYHPFTILVYQATIGMLGLLPLALFETSGKLFSSEIAWGPIIFLAVFCTAMAQVLLNTGVSRLPVSTSGAYFFIIPVLNVIFASILLGEPVTWRLIFGGLMILTGTYMINNRDKFHLKKSRVDPVL